MKTTHILKPLTAACLLSFAGNSLAASQLPSGSNLGYGNASHKLTVHSIQTNPAYVFSKSENRHHFGFGLNVGGGLQQTGANEVINELDDINKFLDGLADNEVLSSANELQDRFTSLILTTRDKFALQFEGQGSMPIFYTHGSAGGFGIDLSAYSGIRMRILSSNKPMDIDLNQLDSNSDSDDLLDAAVFQSALYLKTAALAKASFNYANHVYVSPSAKSELVVGVRINMMEAYLSKSVNSFKDYMGNDGADIADDIELSDITDTQSAVGVDLGVQWMSEFYSLGVTVTNINTPTFEYAPLNSSDATAYRTQLALSEKVELNPQVRLDGAIYSRGGNFTLAGSVDANPTRDLLNNEHQWASVGVSMATRASQKWWYALLPDLRFSYRQNLAGDEQTLMSPGFTWGPLNLDIAFESLDDLSKAGNDADDDTVHLPSSFFVNLGIEFSF